MNSEGVIIKGYNGFYYVWDGNKEWECSLRGKFRKKNQTFLPGDRVRFTILDEQGNKAVIESVMTRQTEMIRPSIANIQQVVIVIAVTDPQPDLWLLDRLLIMAQFQGLTPIICFNKADLLPDDEIKRLETAYTATRTPVFITSGKQGGGLAGLKEILKDKISVLAGPSGVGKSSLLNAIEKELCLKTGEISEKLARGKHVTRHVELIRLAAGGFLADTPGFSQIFLPKELKREDLIGFYPEMEEYRLLCKFNTCLHRDEPFCAVREALGKGLIDEGRYERYRVLLEEVIREERRF